MSRDFQPGLAALVQFYWHIRAQLPEGKCFANPAKGEAAQAFAEAVDAGRVEVTERSVNAPPRTLPASPAGGGLNAYDNAAAPLPAEVAPSPTAPAAPGFPTPADVAALSIGKDPPPKPAPPESEPCPIGTALNEA